MRITRLLASAALAAVLATGSVAQSDFTVFFALDSATITPEGQAILDSAAEEYRRTGEVSVSVVGHTDTTGSPRHNMALSQRRAEAVGAALGARGVPRDSLVLAWRGETELAVQTADNVLEPRNRRVEVGFSGVAEPAPMAEPMAQPRFFIGAGPYFAYNMQEDDESFFAGANVTASYFFTPNIAASAEAAGFYNFDARDDGWGYRVAAGADYHFGDFGTGDGLIPYVGANVGYMAIDGTGKGGVFGGPEVGVRILGITTRLAYDIVEDRDLEDGVISLTLGYEFGF